MQDNQIGQAPWTYPEIRDSIPEFLELYRKKPIQDNQGGMKTPHLFATWYMLKKLNPKNVIESGIWKGQGTWLIENAVPEAKVYSIDLNLGIREYISEKVHYFDKDFASIDWSLLEDKEQTILFFDDHQNAFERMKQGKALGFRQFIFEDNYPASQGDCYSLKKAFQHAGFKPKEERRTLRTILTSWRNRKTSHTILPNSEDAAFLKSTLDIYQEFPPVFKSDTTRWGDAWDEKNYPTPPPLFNESTDQLLPFKTDALFYTWICYARMK